MAPYKFETQQYNLQVSNLLCLIVNHLIFIFETITVYSLLS